MNEHLLKEILFSIGFVSAIIMVVLLIVIVRDRSERSVFKSEREERDRKLKDR